jgi:hypothetical protein
MNIIRDSNDRFLIRGCGSGNVDMNTQPRAERALPVRSPSAGRRRLFRVGMRSRRQHSVACEPLYARRVVCLSAAFR